MFVVQLLAGSDQQLAFAPAAPVLQENEGGSAFLYFLIILILLLIVLAVIWYLQKRSEKAGEERAEAWPTYPGTTKEAAEAQAPAVSAEAAEAEAPAAEAAEFVAETAAEAEAAAAEVAEVAEEAAEVVTPVADTTAAVSEAVEEAAEAAAEKKPDDLKIIEGIGPKVASLLQAAGIRTFEDLANADVEHLRQILVDAGLQMMAPDTWPQQARLAAAGDMEGLKELQASLKGGRAR
ncbi:MAG: helix-hairpin-helix domain-containing protein [Caldilineae bacterium]|nr:MAG: helix-hairpin-helix domain-containing protein [Caldilineae bacterium]